MKKKQLKSTLPEIIEVDYLDLNKFPNMRIVSIGNENLYFEFDGKQYFCKCF